jgi:hypothetical protein
MVQKNPFLYGVSTGEVVTITVTPVKVGPFVSAATLGEVLPNHGGATPTFIFPVNLPAGDSQIGRLFCNFPGDTPADALYEVRVKGSNSPDVFTAPTVKKSAAIHTLPLTFHVE